MKSVILSILLIVPFLSAGLAADDTRELKAAFEEMIKTYREKNTEGFLQQWHPEAVIFTRNRLFPIDRAETARDAWADLIEDIFARVINVDFVPSQVGYRVVSGTGLVWGFAKNKVDSKDELASDLDSRFLATMTKADGSWKILSWHTSAPPLEPR